MKEYIQDLKRGFSLTELEELLKRLHSLKVLIIGDTIIDQYVFVRPKGRAIKDPILSTEFIREENYAGGVLAIANHVSSFVQEITVVTLLGDYNTQQEFIQKNVAANIRLKSFFKEHAPTTVKCRYVQESYRKNKLFKVEFMNDQPINSRLVEEISLYLREELSQYDLVIVSDFGHGFITAPLRRIIENQARFLALNVQSNSANMGYNYFNLYEKADFRTMNEDELRLPLLKRFEGTNEVIQEVHQTYGYRNFLVTRGRNGCTYFYQGQLHQAPILTSSVKDTVGAGDALFAIAALFAYLQPAPKIIPFLANCAGAIGANIIGNKESVSREKLLGFIHNLFQIDIKNYLEAVNETISQINIDKINSLVELLLQTYQNEKTIYAFGNGGSSATASHFIGDLVKGVSYGLQKRFKAICLNDNLPALMAIANDISFDDIFIEQLKNFLSPGDVVIGISGSGNSANVVKALYYAKERGATTVAICGFQGGKSKEICDLVLHAEVNDMEVSEDVHHLILTHCVKRLITQELNNHAASGESIKVGEEYLKRIV